MLDAHTRFGTQRAALNHFLCLLLPMAVASPFWNVLVHRLWYSCGDEIVHFD